MSHPTSLLWGAMTVVIFDLNVLMYFSTSPRRFKGDQKEGREWGFPLFDPLLAPNAPCIETFRSVFSCNQ